MQQEARRCRPVRVLVGLAAELPHGAGDGLLRLVALLTMGLLLAAYLA
jgi:hypothetical protein